MGNFEKIIADEGHLGQTKSSEFFSAQKSAARTGKKELIKELKEDSFAKASILELLVDNMVGKLSLPDNYKIIDEAVGEDGAAQELADRFWKYSERLGSKKIIPNNSLRDVVMNLGVSLMAFVERAKRKGMEKYREVIADDFNNLKTYLIFLEKYSDFEKAELNSELGFLGGKMGKENLETLKLNKSKYIEECKNIFKKEGLWKEEMEKISEAFRHTG
ncbi:hypothetical protein HY798_04095 [Candidatus Falkowbacteria bacterium]|nr:hypothetical protein [Candidatus Falkowbacteria bacterium]